MKVRQGSLFGLYVGLARAGLLFERLWPRLWPAVGLAGVFVVLALLDVLPQLPVWLHAVIVLAFAIAILGLLQREIARLGSVGEAQARHRIETDSGLDHRPLTAIDDEIGAGKDDPAAEILWQAHKRRMAERTRALRLGLPHAGLAKRDPWALRAALTLLLIVGVLAAGNQAGERLGRALVPPLNASAFQRTVTHDIWFTPPAYTRMAPVYIGSGPAAGTGGASAPQPRGEDKGGTAAPKRIEVPAGSAMLAQVRGGGTVPVLTIGEQETELNRVEADAYHLETALAAGGELTLTQNGRELVSFRLDVIADKAPEVSFTAAPETHARQRLRLPFEARDDHGLSSVVASIQRLDGKPVPAGDSEIILRLPFRGEGAKTAKGRSSHDLTDHVWAGLPVLVHLIATDEHGQTGRSVVEPAVLPERQFSHPVAKELVEIRKHMTTDERSRRLARMKIENVTDLPERFDHNTAVYLTLRVAIERLNRVPADTAVAEVQELLWDSALRLEEGIAALAGRDLRAAQEALERALENNASLEELERLMNEVQEALDRFMASLMQQFEELGELPNFDPESQMMTNEDLQRLLDQAREMMRQGSRDAAKELMAELQRMLENLQGALAQGRQQNQQAEEAQEAMRELRDIIRRQQELLDDTFQRQQRGETGDAPLTESQEEQNDIRRQLGEVMKKLDEMLGQVPDNLGRAERRMRDSEKALGQGQPSQAVQPQTEALDALRQGSQSAAQALARQLGRGNQFGRMGRIGPFTGPQLRGLRPGNRDPFGRPAEEDGQSGTATGNVEIPGEMEMKRAREILDELRRRAGDLWRPELELEYIERLLERF